MTVTLLDLTDRESDVLHAIVTLHEQRGGVVVHGQMAQEERDAVKTLQLFGLLEARLLSKDGQRRVVVPTPLGREMIAS